MGPTAHKWEYSAMRVLIFGKSGWIGGLLGELCKAKGISYQYSAHRLEMRESISAEIDSFKPTHVFNAAGLTGRPNVDWCESHKQDVVRVNVMATLSLADLCSLKGVHMTNFATGCIFEYDDEHPMGGKRFTEDDHANFHKSFYSHTKAIVEELLREIPGILTLRVRMPICEDLQHPRNFIFKISKYAKVVDVPNSMTVLNEMLPYAIEMARRGLIGIYNFTNPGVVSHNEMLQMYKEYYNQDFTWENFSLEEQAKILKAGRSNNGLDTTKMENEFPEMLDIHKSLLKYVFEPQPAMKAAKANGAPASS